jgi:UDP-glucose 4-epimerase
VHDLDIRDDALEQVVEQVRPEVVFHLAAQADVGNRSRRPLFDADVNVLGTVRVLEAARAIDARVVFTSVEVRSTGSASGLRARTTSPSPFALRPRNSGRVPRDLEPAARHQPCHLPAKRVTRPRQLPTLEGGVIAIFLTGCAMDGDRIFGDGNQTRDFFTSGDVVGQLLAAAASPASGIFSVGSGIATTVLSCTALRRGRAAPAGAAVLGRAAGDLQHSAMIDPSRAATSSAARRDDARDVAAQPGCHAHRFRASGLPADGMVAPRCATEQVVQDSRNQPDPAGAATYVKATG